MNQRSHAAVWIDHHEAKVFHFNAEGMDKVVLHPEDPNVHMHRNANSIGSGHAAEDKIYLHAVVEALGTEVRPFHRAGLGQDGADEAHRGP